MSSIETRWKYFQFSCFMSHCIYCGVFEQQRIEYCMKTDLCFFYLDMQTDCYIRNMLKMLAMGAIKSILSKRSSIPPCGPQTFPKSLIPNQRFK